MKSFRDFITEKTNRKDYGRKGGQGGTRSTSSTPYQRREDRARIQDTSYTTSSSRRATPISPEELKRAWSAGARRPSVMGTSTTKPEEGTTFGSSEDAIKQMQSLEKSAEKKPSKSFAAASDVSPQMRTQAANASARASQTKPPQRRPLGDTTVGGPVKTMKLGEPGAPSREAAATLHRMKDADATTTARLQSNLRKDAPAPATTTPSGKPDLTQFKKTLVARRAKKNAPPTQNQVQNFSDAIKKGYIGQRGTPTRRGIQYHASSAATRGYGRKGYNPKKVGISDPAKALTNVQNIVSRAARREKLTGTEATYGARRPEVAARKAEGKPQIVKARTLVKKATSAIARDYTDIVKDRKTFADFSKEISQGKYDQPKPQRQRSASKPPSKPFADPEPFKPSGTPGGSSSGGGGSRGGSSRGAGGGTVTATRTPLKLDLNLGQPPKDNQKRIEREIPKSNRTRAPQSGPSSIPTDRQLPKPPKETLDAISKRGKQQVTQSTAKSGKPQTLKAPAAPAPSIPSTSKTVAPTFTPPKPKTNLASKVKVAMGKARTAAPTSAPSREIQKLGAQVKGIDKKLTGDIQGRAKGFKRTAAAGFALAGAQEFKYGRERAKQQGYGKTAQTIAGLSRALPAAIGGTATAVVGRKVLGSLGGGVAGGYAGAQLAKLGTKAFDTVASTNNQVKRTIRKFAPGAFS